MGNEIVIYILLDYFRTPEELLKVWFDYKENLKEQAKEWLKVDYVGKDGMRVA